MRRAFHRHKATLKGQMVEVINNLKNNFDCLLYLNGNSEVEDLLFLGSIEKMAENRGDYFSQLEKFIDSKQDYIVGYFSYDLKNEVEELHSKNHDGLEFPILEFHQPKWVIKINEKTLEIGFLQEFKHELIGLIEQLIPESIQPTEEDINLLPKISKQAYLEKVNTLKEHIQQGDIYEANFTYEYYHENIVIEPLCIYDKLNSITKAPFSCFMKSGSRYLMCGSPERFLKKEGKKITSQPIKGTVKRGKTRAEDEQLKKQLFHDPKERSENVMIVDLVRNDLSRTAAKSSVKVKELFGIYSFDTVHQMISTVTSELKDGIHPVECIKMAFPMGSMTGAPKIRAMQLIEDYESTKRGLYSGAVGYFTPNLDFDFNVVIRSILYNSKTGYLSTMVGGAITSKSIPGKEYEECLVKADAMKRALRGLTDA